MSFLGALAHSHSTCFVAMWIAFCIICHILARGFARAISLFQWAHAVMQCYEWVVFTVVLYDGNGTWKEPSNISAALQSLAA